MALQSPMDSRGQSETVLRRVRQPPLDARLEGERRALAGKMEPRPSLVQHAGNKNNADKEKEILPCVVEWSPPQKESEGSVN